MKHISLKQLLESTIQEGPAEEQELKNLLKQDYEMFVKKLGDNIKDPKFLAAIKVVADENPIQTSDTSIPVTQLMPTQNEIDVDKSLKFPLTDPTSAERILKGGTVEIIGPIITGGGGKFIIDGHHRWSQAYVINPEVKITGTDITNINKPLDGLKVTQLGIAADTGKLEPQPVKGSNLLNMGETDLKTYVINTIADPSVVNIFKKYGKGDSPELIADYIWNNVQQMQNNNRPVSGAPKRDLMPQTDDAPQWKNNAPALTSEQKRWRRIAGLS